MKRIFKTCALLSSFFAVLGASPLKADAEKKVIDAKETIQQMWYRLTDKDTTVLTFDKGASKLTDSQTTELRATLNAVRDTNQLKEIYVVSYADADYPRASKESLSRAQRKLADDRADNVRAKIREVGSFSITTHNMAKKANWFDKTFTTDDARVKAESSERFSKMNDEELFNESLGRFLQDKGGAGKVVVVFRHDKMQVAQK